jgi:integrase
MSQRLTDKIVKSLAAPTRGNAITYDSEVRGFGARITAAGAVAFILNYRVKSSGLERRYTIGSYPDWSVAAARERAKELKRHVDNGGDPIGEHRTARDAPTMADACEQFLAEYVEKKRPATRAEYTSVIRGTVLPTLGSKKLAAVEHSDIERLHRDVTRRGAPIRANRTVAVLSKIYSQAIKWNLCTANPCKGIERNPEPRRQRYLTPDELARLTKALADHPKQRTADIFRLLLWTGARRGEVLGAAWDQFDLAAGVWTKPASNTKQRREHRIPLSKPARQLLTRLRAESGDSPWVFPGDDGHRRNVRNAWASICKRARITGLRIHDLRHSYASTLVSAGFSLPTIGALLGHSLPQTTARYSHLFDDPLRRATEQAGAILSGAKPADVVPLNRRGQR